MTEQPPRRRGRAKHSARALSPVRPLVVPHASSEGSDDFESVVAALQERFRRKTHEQARRAEDAVKRAVVGAVSALQRQVESHESAQGEHMARLREALATMHSEREVQVAAFRDAYREMRSTARAILRRIDEQDRQYDAVVTSFLDAISALGPIELDIDRGQ